MFAKIKITAKVTVLTGMHIGENNGFSAIGACDSPVIRDSYTGDPMLPGSSVKGKMRTLLARSVKKEGAALQECRNDGEVICRLFGTPGDNKKGEKPRPARLQFSDAFVINKKQMQKIGGLTEIKSENFISRSTSIANPRFIERVVKGTEFGEVWFYALEGDREEFLEDMKTFAEGVKLLSVDYLGGSGTRGYGRIGFSDFDFECVYGEIEPALMDEAKTIFKDVISFAATDI